MTFIPKPLSVGTLVTQLWTEVPSALDLDPLKLPEDAPDSLFGEEWDPEEEELTSNLAPLFRRGFDDFPGEDLEDLPRDRRTNGLIDPLPMLGLGDLGERLTGEFGEILRVPEVEGIGGNPEGGTDRLAWYTPFHVDPHRWGIYIREKGLHYLAQQVFEPEGLSYPDALERALQLLYDHESFHFLTEMAATGWELISRQPHYVPYIAAHRNGRKIFNPLEEALAEANAFWPYRHHQCRLFPYKGAVESYLKAGPAGYRDFDKYTSYATRSWGLQELSGQIWPGQAGTFQHFGELGFDFDNRVVNRAQVPVRLVRLRRWRGGWAEFANLLIGLSPPKPGASESWAG
jgi:hypothetical protein